MTAVPCPHCDRSCAGPAGLASHVRSLHPEVLREREARVDDDLATANERPAATPSDFAWEDPPRRGRSAYLIGELAALLPRLKERPGTWARLRVYGTKSSANAARSKARAAEELAGVEFAAHVHGDKGSALYGRWVGVDA